MEGLNKQTPNKLSRPGLKFTLIWLAATIPISVIPFILLFKFFHADFLFMYTPGIFLLIVSIVPGIISISSFIRFKRRNDLSAKTKACMAVSLTVALAAPCFGTAITHMKYNRDIAKLKKRTQQAASLLETYRKENGCYPDSIEAVGLTENYFKSYYVRDVTYRWEGCDQFFIDYFDFISSDVRFYSSRTGKWNCCM